MESSVYIALGSNLGDRELNLLRAIAEIGKLPDTKVRAVSSFYDTQPVGPVEQDNFFNCVIKIASSLSPFDLLKELQRIETAVFGRKRTVHWGPRSMDLDILFYDGLTITEENLTLPHPHLHERRFVLVPLVEIAPDLLHPQLGKIASQLLAELNDTERVVKI